MYRNQFIELNECSLATTEKKQNKEQRVIKYSPVDSFSEILKQ